MGRAIHLAMRIEWSLMDDCWLTNINITYNVYLLNTAFY